jgi:dTDP-4-amino-4,6-dideoxygalactose transaminase
MRFWLVRVAASGSGFVGLFEQAVAQALQKKFAVAATTARPPASRAGGGIKEGDEGIVHTLCYIASASAVR